MNQKLINKLYEARNKGQINKEIEIAEKLNYFFLAGTIAKEHGLFKIAYENFKKTNQKKEIKIIREIVYPRKHLTMRDIKKTKEFYGGEDFKKKYKEEHSFKYSKQQFYKKIKNYLKDSLNKNPTEKKKFLEYINKCKETLKN